MADSESSASQFERNRRWNFIVNASDLISVNLAKSFIFATTILTLYASYLTSSAVLIGLIPAIQQVFFFLPQLFLARKAEGLSRKKPFVVRISILERLPYLFVVLLIFLWPGAPRWLAYVILAVSIATARGSAGLITPAWKAMLGKVIHPRRRALLFSIGVGGGGLLGVGGAALTRFLLNTYRYPWSFGFCFALSFLFECISWFFLSLNREHASKAEVKTSSFQVYLREIPVLLKTDKNFSRYLMSQTLIILGTMAMSFYIIYGRRVFEISDGFAGSLTMAALFTQSFGIPVLGWFSDRRGHKWLAELTAVLGVSALALVLVAPGPLWLYPVFIAMNLSHVGMLIAINCITMEFGGIDRLPTYTAISGSLFGIPMMLAPVLGGWILDQFGFKILFTTAIVFSLLGLVTMIRAVRDPRIYGTI
jgi:MFS family permease